MPAEPCVAQLAIDWPDAPDWARALAAACDRLGQATVARQLGVSATLINRVRKGQYGRAGHHGDLSRVEALVRGRFLGATTSCPVQGEIPTDRCIANQALPLLTTSRARVELWRACRSGCPHSRIGGNDAQ